jgi:hypothetical protein
MISNRSGVIINVNSGAGKIGFSNLSAYCASKFGLLGLAESLALEVDVYNNNIRLMTIFLGQVTTRMWQDFDFSYYEKNKNKMLSPQDVAEKIIEMIFDSKTYKNVNSVEMYNNMSLMVTIMYQDYNIRYINNKLCCGSILIIILHYAHIASNNISFCFIITGNKNSNAFIFTSTKGYALSEHIRATKQLLPLPITVQLNNNKTLEQRRVMLQ